MVDGFSHSIALCSSVILFFSGADVQSPVDESVMSLISTDIHLRSHGCLFEVSIALPSGATIALEGDRNTDAVGSLVAKLSLLPELRGHVFHTMHSKTSLNHELTMCRIIVPPRKGGTGFDCCRDLRLVQGDGHDAHGQHCTQHASPTVGNLLNDRCL